ncbi:MAG: hypothetical protein QY322_02755 [bacterium]|nr:MAG: hypothetical protein QY322_02755 [bacterium]
MTTENNKWEKVEISTGHFIYRRDVDPKNNGTNAPSRIQTVYTSYN